MVQISSLQTSLTPAFQPKPVQDTSLVEISHQEPFIAEMLENSSSKFKGILKGYFTAYQRKSMLILRKPGHPFLAVFYKNVYRPLSIDAVECICFVNESSCRSEDLFRECSFAACMRFNDLPQFISLRKRSYRDISMVKKMGWKMTEEKRAKMIYFNQPI